MGTGLKSRTASGFLMFLVFWEALTRSFVKFRGRPSASLRVPTREAGFLLNVRAAGDDSRSKVVRTKSAAPDVASPERPSKMKEN